MAGSVDVRPLKMFS